jgi:hypothetical protein
MARRRESMRSDSRIPQGAEVNDMRGPAQGLEVTPPLDSTRDIPYKRVEIDP